MSCERRWTPPPPPRAMASKEPSNAWKKVVASAPDKLAPRRQYARVLREAERWMALGEALKEEEAKAAQTPGEKVAVLREIATLYREHLRNDVQSINTLNQILALQPENLAIYDELVAQYEAKKRWPIWSTPSTRRPNTSAT